MRLRHLMIVIALVLLGCAPSPPERLDMVRQLVARAYAQNADTLAPELYRKATRELEEAEKALRRHEGDEAEEWVVQAEQTALAALYRTRQMKKRQMELQLSEEPDLPDVIVTPSGPKIVEPQVGQEAPARPKPPKKVVQKPKPKAKYAGKAKGTAKAKPKPLAYVKVREGESLFMIARRRDVYGDALLWPLIYQANRDQIKDPRQIFPGQELMVPRDVSDADMERARQFARQSKIFPME